jgi:ABC-type multidrug transport system ATPase subunit
MATPAIEIEHLSKEYPYGFLNLKKKKSLEDLSMRVETGEVFGFLGPNGAGKSTTIKLLMRLIFPEERRESWGNPLTMFPCTGISDIYRSSRISTTT